MSCHEDSKFLAREFLAKDYDRFESEGLIRDYQVIGHPSLI